MFLVKTEDGKPTLFAEVLWFLNLHFYTVYANFSISWAVLFPSNFQFTRHLFSENPRFSSHSLVTSNYFPNPKVSTIVHEGFTDDWLTYVDNYITLPD